EFLGGTDWEEKWNNIESGELWGIREASTTEYSFTDLTEAVQSSLDGGNNYIWIGIKNQDEVNIERYVSLVVNNVDLEVSYTLTTTVNQVDELGYSFGQVGLWLGNNWNYITVPFGLELQPYSNLGLKSDNNFKTGTYQKYWKWTQNSSDIFTNHHNFTIQSGINELISTFKSSQQGIQLKTKIENIVELNGRLEFKDPW